MQIQPQPADTDPSLLTSPIQQYLQRLFEKYAQLEDGAVATYIPELSRANPNWFGIAVATTDGEVYEVGTSRQQFTIQSISKPFVYGLALEDRGRPEVLAKIGVEPTGDAFNSISLHPVTGCPLNPMINAGAIASTSLIAGNSPEDRLAAFSPCCPASSASASSRRPSTSTATACAACVSVRRCRVT